MDNLTMYGLTTLLFFAGLPLLFLLRRFTIFRVVILLFVLDSALTIEAAYDADVISIAILHIITVPAFFGLIYFDLINHHKSQFLCFLCGKEILPEEEVRAVTRLVARKLTKTNVHASCLSSGYQESKPISERVFKRGIPK